MPYQSLPETIEKADEKEGLALILKNQDAIPSLYFTEQRKEQFATRTKVFEMLYKTLAYGRMF